MACVWSVAAVIDPQASQEMTQTGLFFAWLAGGTAYEVLLLLLVANR